MSDSVLKLPYAAYGCKIVRCIGLKESADILCSEDTQHRFAKLKGNHNGNPRFEKPCQDVPRSTIMILLAAILCDQVSLAMIGLALPQ